MNKKVKIIVIISLILLILLGIIIYVLYLFNYIEHKKYTNEDFGIEKYYSSVDYDNDGIDDQTDILNGAREYIATKPVYKSKYYETGYPNDKYGVCVDVVGFALKSAGYDLQSLVDNDIKKNKDKYDSDAGDSNIDFRRVRNLKVYFANNYEPLTLDIYDINAWQGGDIIIFKKHIGIISDKRNKKGVPFIIHHSSNLQANYEEDILELRNDIIGHYRFS